MEIATQLAQQTKSCIFCAETIAAAAIKCRFCNEFLNTEKAKKLIAEQSGDLRALHELRQQAIVFAAKPSLWALTGAISKGMFFVCIAVFLIIYPLEGHPWFNSLSDAQAINIGYWRVVTALALIILTACIITYKVVRLKMTYYEVTADRIEFNRGIFDRRVDNIDMFRVVDLSLRRSILDCFVGTGTVILITTDKTDPEFVFEKVHKPRLLYDVIKKASLEADSKNSVIHLE